MGQGRRQFTDEFKREAIALLAGSGRPLLQIAGELGISPSMLRNWRNRSEGRNAGSALRPIPAPAPHSAPDSASEITRLRRENDRLRMERDILKTYGPPRPQEACARRSDRSASTYPVSGRSPRPRWRSARAGPHKSYGIDAPFFKPGFQSAGSTVRPSRFHHPQISVATGLGGLAANLVYTAAS
jgi:transposase